MSAGIVSKTHIDRMVSTAMDWAQIEPRADAATEFGRMLWTENLKSVAARYPNDKSGERPGTFGLSDKEIRGYEFTAYEIPPLTPVEMAKAIDCLEYQSCEHDGWKRSVACRTLEKLLAACVERMPGYTLDNYFTAPGYDAAPWGID
jgi:hypothetical protein